MVKYMTPEQRAEYWRAIDEDVTDFMDAHRDESRGQKWKFIEARLIPLSGMRLRELEKIGYIECNGESGYRPI